MPTECIDVRLNSVLFLLLGTELTLTIEACRGKPAKQRANDMRLSQWEKKSKKKYDLFFFFWCRLFAVDRRSFAAG